MKFSGQFEKDTPDLTNHILGAMKPVNAFRQKSTLSELELSQLQGFRQYKMNIVTDFLKLHAEALYDMVVQPGLYQPSLKDVVDRTAELAPMLVSTPAKGNGTFKQAGEQWFHPAIDQGIFYSGLMLNREVGRRFIEDMLCPNEEAFALVERLDSGEKIELDTACVELKGVSGRVTMKNSDCLNAEDNQHIRDMEIAIDLVLLSKKAKVGVLRGGEVNNRKYFGKRVFSAGINLKELASGRVDFLGFLLQREFGYVNKLLRGLRIKSNGNDGVVINRIKPWIAAVDGFAIGGGMQLLLVCDYVIAERGAYASLPAAKEGLVPGLGNLRLGKLHSKKLAKRVILLGERIDADNSKVDLQNVLFDRIVDSGAMEREIEVAVETLKLEAVVPNKRMIVSSIEPLESFQRYMADFSFEQSVRSCSEEVKRNSLSIRE